jgi:hypothetical protein
MIDLPESGRVEKNKVSLLEWEYFFKKKVSLCENKTEKYFEVVGSRKENSNRWNCVKSLPFLKGEQLLKIYN